MKVGRGSNEENQKASDSCKSRSFKALQEMESSLRVNTHKTKSPSAPHTSQPIHFKLQNMGNSSQSFYKIFRVVNNTEGSSSMRYYSRTGTWIETHTYLSTLLNQGWKNIGKGSKMCTPSLLSWWQVTTRTFKKKKVNATNWHCCPRSILSD